MIYFAGQAVEVNGSSFMLPADFPNDVVPSSLARFALSDLAMIDAFASCLGPMLFIIDGYRVPTTPWNQFTRSRDSRTWCWRSVNASRERTRPIMC